MRKLGLPFLLVATGAALAFACSSTAEDDSGEANVQNLSDDDLAKAALKIMGAPQIQRDPGDQVSCSFTGCHSINPVTLRQWGDQYTKAMTELASNDGQQKKIDYFRQNPADERTGFTPERIGIMAAGAHLALGANVNKDRHPNAYAQGQALAKVFEGKDDLYAEFRKEMLMPVLADYPRLSPSQYETILTWFKKGMPKLKELIPEDRPNECADNFGPLKDWASQNKNQNWAALNKSHKVPMFGCAPPDANESPTKCLQQTKDGKEIFPSSESQDFSKGWATGDSTVRVLRALTSPNSYWLRSSADGRFAMTGGGQNGGAQAIDLQATLDGGSRDIGLQASYDPDFWPDNKAFMFQGGTKFCAQSLLEKASTEKVTFGEPECSSLSSASGLYQTVGQVLGDNSIGDRFILYSIWAGDSGSYSASARDTEPRAGGDSAIKIFTAIASGNDVEDGYKVKGDGFSIPTQYRGDTMMGRSGRILGSRWAYDKKPDGSVAAGYAIEKLDRTVINGAYRFTLNSMGNVCMKGNKANFSFDERFLASHHYNEPNDYQGADKDKYKDLGSSDVIIADFVTGKKATITKMNPGQFALYSHFRSDGWLYFLVVDHNTGKYYVAASDWAVRQVEANPTP